MKRMASEAAGDVSTTAESKKIKEASSGMCTVEKKESKTAVGKMSGVEKKKTKEAAGDLSTVAKKKTKIVTPETTIALQVVGTGADGSPKSVLVNMDHNRYLFNCGEGTQRIAFELPDKMSKLTQVFITRRTWSNLGGLIGMSLSLNSSDVITLHGPADIEKVVMPEHRAFSTNTEVEMCKRDLSEGYFEDGVMRVDYLKLYDDQSQHCDDLIPPITPQECDDVAVAYLCRPKPRLRTLDGNKCKALGIPNGMIRKELKAGRDISLADGRQVRAEDVLEPADVQRNFLVVEVPAVTYLPSLERACARHCDVMGQDDVMELVVHLAPVHVMQHACYRAWMNSFSSDTHHLILNESGSPVCHEGLYEMQAKLNLLCPKIFPLLPHQTAPGTGDVTPCIDVSPRSDLSQDDVLLRTDDAPHSDIASHTDVHVLQCDEISRNDAAMSQSAAVVPHINNMPHSDIVPHHDVVTNTSHTAGVTGLMYRVRGGKNTERGWDREQCFTLDNGRFTKELLEDEVFTSALSDMKQVVASANAADTDRSTTYPEVIFLGTGSMMPNKARNVSAILVGCEPGSWLLLDCGEGSYGQLVRHFGAGHADDVLRGLRGVFISHMHADHHMGLCAIAEARLAAYTKRGEPCPPLMLLAPKGCQQWLQLLYSHILSADIVVDMIRCDALWRTEGECTPCPDVQRVCTAWNMHGVETCRVHHRADPHALIVRHAHGWSLAYSGDTQPCERLAERARGVDILIHEATMEDGMEEEARDKRHSTMSEALGVARSMQAGFTLLTHFSQRYPKLPLFGAESYERVGFAFDNMRVTPGDLPLLPRLVPVLKAMFASDYSEVEETSQKRVKKKEAAASVCCAPSGNTATNVKEEVIKPNRDVKKCLYAAVYQVCAMEKEITSESSETTGKKEETTDTPTFS